MKPFFRPVRNVLFWLHLAVGVVAGLAILVMSATGAVLAFEQQILAGLNRHYAQTSPAGAVRLPASELITRAKVIYPAGTGGTLTMYADPGRPAMVSFGREASVYLDPVTGNGGMGTGQAFFKWNVELHRYILLSGDARAFGKGVTGVGNLMFLFIVVSGLILWLPPAWTWTVVKLHLIPSLTLKGKTRDWNWHNALGIWAFVPMIVIVPAGAVISYKWVSDLVFKAAGEMPPGQAAAAASRPAGSLLTTRTSVGEITIATTREAGTTRRGVTTLPAGVGTVVVKPMLTLDEAVELASGYFQPWNSMSFGVPRSAHAAIVFTLDRGTGRQPQHKATLNVNPMNGERSFETATAKTKGQRWRLFMRFAHTGEYFGLVGQFVGMVACLAACVLVYTGIALSVRRGWNWWRRGKTAA